MNTQKYQELLLFFKKVLEEVSKEKYTLFKEFLKDLKIKESQISKVKITDKNLKDVLKDIHRYQKIKKSLEKSRPPKRIQEIIDSFISEKEQKIRQYFSKYNPKKNELTIKRDDRDLKITASRKFFTSDERIITDKDTFDFRLSCFYRKEKKQLEMSLECRFKVKEEYIQEMNSDNLVLFDEFVESIGLEDFSKNVDFSAIYSEGEFDFSSNTCNVQWFKITAVND